MTRTQTIIKNMRLNYCLTQEKFANEIGVSVSTVKQWERGNNYVSPENLSRIKEFLESRLSAGIDDREYIDSVMQNLIADKITG